MRAFILIWQYDESIYFNMTIWQYITTISCLRYDDQFMIKRWVKVPASTRSSRVVTESWRWYRGLRNTVKKYTWEIQLKNKLRNTVEIYGVMKMVSGPGRSRARCMSARAMPYWRDIEKSCFILMAFLCIVNWPSAHIWGKGGRDATTTPANLIK